MDNFTSGDVGVKNNTTQSTDTSSVAEHPDNQAALIIWKVCPPFILFFGGFGNIATIFVMRRTKDHNSSLHAIFMSLAMSDLMLLCTATTHDWISYVFSVKLNMLHAAVCKVLSWLEYISGATSAWLVTCVTVQRTMAVLWPHRMQAVCTVRRTWIVIATLVLTACAFYVHTLAGFDISKEDRCQTVPGLYRYFYVVVFSWVKSGMTSIFPIVCVFVCNGILSVTLFKAVSSSSLSANADSGTALSTDRRKKMSVRMTLMVLAIACGFLVLTLPICVYFIWAGYVFQSIGTHPRTIPMVNLVHAVVCQLWFANSGVNFYLYCLTGTKFRREFMNWICCGDRGPSAPSVHKTTSEAPGRGRHKHHGQSQVSK